MRRTANPQAKKKKRIDKMIRRLKKKTVTGKDYIKKDDKIIYGKNGCYPSNKQIDFRQDFSDAKDQGHKGFSAIYSISSALKYYSTPICENALLKNISHHKKINFRNITDYLMEQNIINGFAIIDHDHPKKILNNMKLLLEAKIPIIGSFLLPIDAVSKTCTSSGKINYKWITNVNHSVVFTGYDDEMTHNHEKGFFIFQNSWGPKWGDSGFGYLSYNYINYKKYNHMLILNDQIPDTLKVDFNT